MNCNGKLSKGFGQDKESYGKSGVLWAELIIQITPNNGWDILIQS